jgi:hypothetical protein
MTVTVFDVLRKSINLQINDAIDVIIGGGIKDFTQFKETTGFIRGLNSCLREIDDLSRNLEGYEDDD